jgi:hypothetical protein
MRQGLTLALILVCGAAGIEAQQLPVWMTFSGSNVATQINLQSGAAPADSITLAGHSSLGSFTWHEVAANAAAPSGTCGGPNLINFPTAGGAGVFRFQDGSLLTTKITAGSACVDVTTLTASLKVTDQITGGTGIFKNASGQFTYTIAARAVLVDTTMSPVFFAVSGEGSGTIVLSNTM